LLEFIEEAFNAVSAFVAEFVVIELFATARNGRNHGLNAVYEESLTNPISIIAFVKRSGFKNVVFIKALIEHFELAAIMSVAFG